MMTDDDMNVVLTDGQIRVTLIPSGSPMLGSPTQVCVVAPPFSVAIEADAFGFPAFRDQLIRLHETLKGEARLEFLEQQHVILLKGDGLGRVVTRVEVTNGRQPKQVWLTVEMHIDQSYLPELIRRIEVFFLRREGHSI